MSQNHDHESHNGNFDIHAAARRVLLAAKFEPDINQAAHKQLDALTSPAPMPTGVRDLRGHMNAWLEAGLPVERSAGR